MIRHIRSSFRCHAFLAAAADSSRRQRGSCRAIFAAFHAAATPIFFHLLIAAILPPPIFFAYCRRAAAARGLHATPISFIAAAFAARRTLRRLSFRSRQDAAAILRQPPLFRRRFSIIRDDAVYAYSLRLPPRRACSPPICAREPLQLARYATQASHLRAAAHDAMPRRLALPFPPLMLPPLHAIELFRRLHRLSLRHFYHRLRACVSASAMRVGRAHVSPPRRCLRHADALPPRITR